MVEIDYTNEVLMNHYKKQEIKKSKRKTCTEKNKSRNIKISR